MSLEYKAQSEYFFPLFADDLFCDLSPRSFAAFAEIKQTKQFQKGACIFFRGDAARRIYILRAGKAQLLLNEEVKNIRVARLIEPNEIFGLTAAIVNLLHENDAKTIAPCTCEFIDRDDFIHFLHDEPEVCFRLVKLLGLNFQKSISSFFLR